MQASGGNGGRRLCYFAHFHPAGLVADYVLHYLTELRRAGFTIIVASTAALSEDEAEKLRAACDDLKLREYLFSTLEPLAGSERDWEIARQNIASLTRSRFHPKSLQDSSRRLLGRSSRLQGR